MRGDEVPEAVGDVDPRSENLGSPIHGHAERYQGLHRAAQYPSCVAGYCRASSPGDGERMQNFACASTGRDLR